MNLFCRILLLFFLICCDTFSSKGQSRDGEIPVGFSFAVNSFRRTSVELGFGLVKDFRYHKGKRSVIYDRYGIVTADIASEFHFGKNFLVGPKLSGRCSFEFWDWEFNSLGLIAGVDNILYSDWVSTNAVLRPVIGVHFFLDLLELNYGYNFRMDHHSPLPINTHVLQLKFKPFVFLDLMKNFAEK